MADDRPLAPAQAITAAAAESVRPVAASHTDAAPARRIASQTLFAGASEVHISHQGALYRLKQTALGKLILTK